jgi:hypothetical protein
MTEMMQLPLPLDKDTVHFVGLQNTSLESTIDKGCDIAYHNSPWCTFMVVQIICEYMYRAISIRVFCSRFRARDGVDRQMAALLCA